MTKIWFFWRNVCNENNPHICPRVGIGSLTNFPSIVYNWIGVQSPVSVSYIIKLFPSLGKRVVFDNKLDKGIGTVVFAAAVNYFLDVSTALFCYVWIVPEPSSLVGGNNRFLELVWVAACNENRANEWSTNREEVSKIFEMVLKISSKVTRMTKQRYKYDYYAMIIKSFSRKRP